MPNHDTDLFVIGGGSGGVRAARMAAQAGARVAIVESYRYGGTCVIRGCVPKKLLVYASHFHEDFGDAAGFGWTVGGPVFDWTRLIADKDREIDRLEGVYERLLNESGVEVLRGHGRLLDAHRVEVEGVKTFSAETILIATGGHPVFPPGHGWEHAISSNEVFHLKRLPERVLVYGGGYIAVEFAGIFNGLGAQVTQVYRGPQILRGFDDDVRNTLAGELVKKGIDLRVETLIDRIEKEGETLRVHLSGGQVHDCGLVLAATGRRPNTANLGLDRRRRRDDRQGGGQGGRPVADQPTQHLRRGRRDRPHRAHPRGDRRGHGLRRYRLPRTAARHGPRERGFCRVQPAAGLHRGPDRDPGPRAAGRDRRLPLDLPALEAHPLGARRNDHDEADRGSREPEGRRRPHGRPGCAGRSSRASPSPSRPGPPRPTST